MEVTHFNFKPGTAARQVYAQLRCRSKRIGRRFKISFRRFLELSNNPCHYCGSSPSNTWKRKYETFRYNGIDRIDSLKGYVEENITSCCKQCNYMKNSWSVEEFLDHVNKITNHTRQWKPIVSRQ